jgi:hypothetical protein
MSLRDDLDIDGTPPPPGPKRFIRRIKANESFTFLCYSAVWWALWTHWDGSRSQPHFKRKDRCDGCKRGLPKRWKGYLDVYNSDTKQREFLECPPGVAEQFELALPRGENFRGQRFTVKRGLGQKARCRVNFHAHISVAKPGHVMPKPEDPCDILLSLWGFTDVRDQLGDDDSSAGIPDVG